VAAAYSVSNHAVGLPAAIASDESRSAR
jgi:hypothetical protein